MILVITTDFYGIKKSINLWKNNLKGHILIFLNSNLCHNYIAEKILELSSYDVPCNAIILAVIEFTCLKDYSIKKILQNPFFLKNVTSAT